MQSNLQTLGFYNRGTSVIFFFSFLLLLVAIYFILAIKSATWQINKWMLIFALSVPLLFSFAAFTSYDIFNYIFDARIVTQYHQNPYQYSALSFAGDPMLHFMRWTHRTYPYGPMWLVPGIIITLISSKLLIQMFLFKLLATSTLIFTAHLMSSKLKTNAYLLIFNPLIILEVLISAHNDVYIMFFTVIALVYLTRKKTSQAFLLIGGLTKFVNLFLIPVFLIFKKPSEKFYLSSIIMTTIAIVLASFRSEFQTWYLIWLLPFAYLLKKGHFIRSYIILASILLPFSYLPYIYTGAYDGTAYYLKYLLLFVSLPIAFIIRRYQPNLL